MNAKGVAMARNSSDPTDRPQAGMGDRTGCPDAAEVARMVAARFPQWADLPVTALDPQGQHKFSFRLGDDMVVRLPSGAPDDAAHDTALAAETAWLPRIARLLPVAVPEVLAQAEPDERFPHPWSVRRWLPGQSADRADPAPDRTAMARDLARALRALHGAPVAGAPRPGPNNLYRGAPPRQFDSQTRALIGRLGDRIDADAAQAVWDAGMSSDWQHAPVWVHGGLGPDKLILHDGRLSALLDWGLMAVGDPACDLQMAWTGLSGDARAALRLALPFDAGTWERARALALRETLLRLEAGQPLPPGLLDDLLTPEPEEAVEDRGPAALDDTTPDEDEEPPAT